jgi:radical SAM protein with 4Fe4S-binding SPASM domain
MYKDLVDLITHSTSLGLPTSIATNGTLLHKFAEDFARIPLYLLQVSIDGHCAEMHNRIRRAVSGEDCYQKAVDGIMAVREARGKEGAGLPLIASLTTISRDNHANLVDIYHSMADKVDFLVFYPSWWIDEESCEAHSRDFARRFGQEPELHRGWVGGWKPEDYQTLDGQLSQLRRLSMKPGNPAAIILPDIAGVDALTRYYSDHSETFGYKRCMSIHQVVELNSNGDLSPCRDYHDYVVGNIQDSTITELWQSSRFAEFRKSMDKDGLMPVCTRCCGLMGY